MEFNWGVFEERTDKGRFTAYHVVPIINCDGEAICSANHVLHSYCHCKPFHTLGGSGIPSQLNHKGADGKLLCWEVWQHFDPDHPGALSHNDWIEKRRAAMRETATREANATFN
jgi:hypothetical protein